MRKKPKQARSEKTIEFICEAAAQLLNHTDTSKFTTNHIAQRAGVSIGTLYRYFPDKNSLLKFIVEQEMALMSAKAIEAIKMSKAKDRHDLLEEIIEVSMSVFSQRQLVFMNVRKLLVNEKEVFDNLHNKRLKIIRQLHNRLLDIDPAMGKSIDDDTLMIAIDAFFGAVRGLAQKNIDKDTEKSIRIKLLDILLITFSDSDEQ